MFLNMIFMKVMMQISNIGKISQLCLPMVFLKEPIATENYF